VIATGEVKGNVPAKALQETDNINKFPVRLTIESRSTCVLDQATKAFYRNAPQNLQNTGILCS
jgi:hypothetical protein